MAASGNRFYQKVRLINQLYKDETKFSLVNLPQNGKLMSFNLHLEKGF